MEIDLALMWRDLMRGTQRVSDAFFSEERCYLVLAPALDGEQAPVTGRRLEILESVLGGLRQKNVALELVLAPSTIALNSRLALQSLGVVDKPSRVHPLLMLAARAAVERAQVLARCSTIHAPESGSLRVVSMPRPDLALEKVLPGAELAVIRSLVEGRTYRDIARQRGTSTRTVANQISAVFRRLHVSGRNELVQRLSSEQPLRSSEQARSTIGPAPLDGAEAPRQSA
jgi:DNA-binding NarL/FixJ family response regulator